MTAVPNDARRLIYSNDPETVANTVTLPLNLYIWRQALPASGSVEYRVCVWHGHEFTSKRFLHLVAKGASDTNLLSHKSIYRDRREGLLYQAGICLAEAQVLVPNTLDIDYDFGLPVGNDVVFKTYGIEPPINVPGHGVEAHYACAVHEFRLQGTPGADVEIRIVLSDDDDVGTFDSGVADSDEAHVRGSWPQSSILLTPSSGQSLDLVDVANRNIAFGIADEEGEDTKLYRKQSDDPDGCDRGNDGLYGVNISYQVPYANTTNPQQTFFLRNYVRARATGEDFWGGINGVPAGIPPIEAIGTNRQAVLVSQAAAGGHPVPIMGGTFTPGGAATLPVDVNIRATQQGVPDDA